MLFLSILSGLSIEKYGILPFSLLFDAVILMETLQAYLFSLLTAICNPPGIPFCGSRYISAILSGLFVCQSMTPQSLLGLAEVLFNTNRYNLGSMSSISFNFLLCICCSLPNIFLCQMVLASFVNILLLEAALAILVRAVSAGYSVFVSSAD